MASTSHRMENEDSPSETSVQSDTPAVVPIETTKRKLVDIEGDEIQDPKKMKEFPDMEVKQRALCLLLHWHEFLVLKFKVKHFNNIDIIADVTSIVWTIHSKFRQDANGAGCLFNRINDEFTFKVGTAELKWGLIKAEMKKTGMMYGFKYELSESGKAQTGTLGSILAMFATYRVRFNEVRIGNTNITLQKKNGELRQVPISTFGLRPEHAILMTGCTYNPSIQNGMKQLLGPMTIAINLAMQDDMRYGESWKNTFVQIFKLFPNAQEIANLIAGSRAEQYTILKLLADISLWGTTRKSNKAVFPFSLMLTVARRTKEYDDFFSRDCPNTVITNTMLNPVIKTFDFSGKAAYRFWSYADGLEYRIRMGKEATTQDMAEAVFHAVWGTHNEDLSLLEWMTGHTFQTRREMGKCFEGKGTVEESASFRLIKFKRVAMLANSSQTDFLSGGKGQISRLPVFSGICRQRVNIALFKTLVDERDDYVDRTSERAKIVGKLNRLKLSVATRLRKEPSMVFDTTKFFAVGPDGCGAEINETPELTGKYFYGQDDEF